MNSQKLTIQQAMSRANKAAQKGKIADAVELYTVVLQHQPNHPIAKKDYASCKRNCHKPHP